MEAVTVLQRSGDEGLLDWVESAFGFDLHSNVAFAVVPNLRTLRMRSVEPGMDVTYRAVPLSSHRCEVITDARVEPPVWLPAFVRERLAKQTAVEMAKVFRALAVDEPGRSTKTPRP